LQGQIFELLCSEFIDPSLIDDGQSCARILEIMMEDLLGKVIVRDPKQTGKRIHDRLNKGHRHIAHQISFERDDEYGIQIVLVAQQIEPRSQGQIRIQIPWRVRP
jgi:hypothetical protein